MNSYALSVSWFYKMKIKNIYDCNVNIIFCRSTWSYWTQEEYVNLCHLISPTQKKISILSIRSKWILVSQLCFLIACSLFGIWILLHLFILELLNAFIFLLKRGKDKWFHLIKFWTMWFVIELTCLLKTLYT